MRNLTLFLTFCLFLWLASSSPINQKRRLINRPSIEEIFAMRGKRHAYEHEVKGSPRVYSANTHRQPIELNLRKGEYVCEDRVCKLKPGEVPKGCNGVCQHPI